LQGIAVVAGYLIPGYLLKNSKLNPVNAMYNELDPVLNTPVRLAIVSALIKMKQADFNYLMEITNTTQGNLSHQIKS